MATQTRQDLFIANPPDDAPRGNLLPTKKGSDDAERRIRKEFVAIKDYLNNVADHAVAVGQNRVNKERRRKIAKMRMMYEGDQIIRWDERQQTWINKKKPGDALYVDHVLATFIDIITAQVAKSRSAIIVTPRNEEKVEKRQAAKYATELIKDASESLMNARNTQREVKYGFLLSGEAYRHTFFDRNVEGRGITKPKYGVKMTKGSEAAWECPQCDASGKMSGLKGSDLEMSAESPSPELDGTGNGTKPRTRCPECDFPEVNKIGGKSFAVHIEEDPEYENIGDVNTEFVDGLEMTVVGARDHIGDALAVVRDRMIPRCVLEAVFPGKDLPSTGVPDNLKYKEAAMAKTRDSDVATGAEAFEMLHFQEVWLNPAIYDAYESPRDEKLANGEKIKAHERLAPMMPKGAYFCRVGRTIVDLYEQAIKDCWSHAVNSITSDFHGQGEWDLMPQQEQKNEIRSMQINGIMLDSFRPLMARNGAIDIGKIPNKAGAIVKINNLTDDKPLSHALDRVPGGGTIPDAYILDDKLAGSMQQRAGAFSSTTDLPDAKMLGTATGVATLAEHAVGRRAPMLALRAEMEKEQGYQFLELRQQYWPDKMYESMDKQIGGDAGRWFRESNIRRDFIVQVVAESFMPTTAAQDSQNFAELMTAMIPLSGGDPAVLKQLRRRAVELYGRGVDLDNYQLEKVESASRLEKLKAIAAFFESEFPVTDPMGQVVPEFVQGVLTETTKAIKMPHVSNTAENMMNPDGAVDDQLQFMPVDALLDNHVEYIEIYSDWLKSSEGRDSSLFLRTCVRTLIEKHRDGELQRVITEKTEANLAQIPDLQAQQMAMESQAAQDAELGEEQFQQQLDQQSRAADEMAATQAKHQMVGQALGLDQGAPPSQ